MVLLEIDGSYEGLLHCHQDPVIVVVVAVVVVVIVIVIVVVVVVVSRNGDIFNVRSDGRLTGCLDMVC